MEIEAKFKAIPENDRACKDDEISDVCGRLCEISTLVDGMFAIAQTPTDQATEAILQTTEKYVKAVSVKWRELGLTGEMPKLHAMLDHLVP